MNHLLRRMRGVETEGALVKTVLKPKTVVPAEAGTRFRRAATNAEPIVRNAAPEY